MHVFDLTVKIHWSQTQLLSCLSQITMIRILKWPRKYPIWFFFKIPNTKTYMYHWYNSDLITYKILIIPLILCMIVSSILYYIAFSIVQREWKICIMYVYWNVFWNFVFVICDTLCCPRKTCPMTSRYKLTVNSRMPSHPFYCEFPFIHWYL